MFTTRRRASREVLRDRRGVAANLTEALAGLSMKGIVIAGAATVVAGGLAYWGIASASASSSSEFQNANQLFEQSVKASDVVVGYAGDRVNILTDAEGGKCEIQSWQASTNDDIDVLRVDTETVAGVCTPSKGLLEAGSAKSTIVMASEVETPVFEYANLGGRTITFSNDGSSTLASGVKPDGVKQSDWDDTRPYKVTLELTSSNEKAAKAATRGVATGYTNVVNVAAADDQLRYVPAPSDAPVPGPISIGDVQRSTTEGTEIAGVREGISVTFSGGVCTAGPTKVTITYTQQSPSTAPPVTVVRTIMLNGDATTIDLGLVPNGSTGIVEAGASCIDGGVVEKTEQVYTQPIPPTVLTVKQNAAPEKHDLSWIPVSSLPTTFDLTWSVGGETEKALTSTSALKYTSVGAQGANLGLKSEYWIVAKVGGVTSPKATADITNPLPQAPATSVTPRSNGATWSAITCPPFTTAEYSPRYHQQAGTSTAVNWSPYRPFSTERTLTGVTTPSYGRTVVEVDTRCVAQKSDAISERNTSKTASYYVPEAMQMSIARSTTAGEMIGGVREGVQLLYTGARCYGGVPTQLQASSYAIETNHSEYSDTTRVMPGGTKTIDFPKVPNGSEAEVEAYAYCADVASDSTGGLTFFEQTVPTPVHSVAQGANANQHVVSWNKVSSLPTTFRVFKTAAKGSENANPPATTALSQTLNYVAGTNYGNKTDYVVDAEAGVSASRTGAKSITTAWPAPPGASNIRYTRTGQHNNFAYGNVRWDIGSCPTGTTLKVKMLENRHGNANRTMNNAVLSQTPWTNNMKQTDWGPSYARQGYPYGVGVHSLCSSNVTGFESNTHQGQSGNWVIPMATPSKPGWYGLRLSDGWRGPDWMPSTCTHLNNGCFSMIIDWTHNCPAGSRMNNNWYTATSWSNTSYGHNWGWYDTWQTPNNSRQTVYYHSAWYTCQSDWGHVSPGSPHSDRIRVNVG